MWRGRWTCGRRRAGSEPDPAQAPGTGRTNPMWSRSPRFSGIGGYVARALTGGRRLAGSEPDRVQAGPRSSRIVVGRAIGRAPYDVEVVAHWNGEDYAFRFRVEPR